MTMLTKNKIHAPHSQPSKCNAMETMPVDMTMAKLAEARFSLRKSKFFPKSEIFITPPVNNGRPRKPGKRNAEEVNQPAERYQRENGQAANDVNLDV